MAPMLMSFDFSSFMKIIPFNNLMAFFKMLNPFYTMIAKNKIKLVIRIKYSDIIKNKQNTDSGL